MNFFLSKRTFNVELPYTTKLQKGPHMRGLEREAMRIAREIEGEYTKDLHLAGKEAFIFTITLILMKRPDSLQCTGWKG
ncbi:hypothetical protein SLEP1_g21325 [Rubroshorea leprosula]|uniref:LsmAD domain-containing protein n=1 Tax=Rubroshorea leprosula TaxID=152421 RepID=A0AAV5JEU8_9ROSI|nr:hypothetical protein SLEP1_g21325 [Rubroshorea leprosula]